MQAVLLPAIPAYKPLGKPPAHLSPADRAVWRELMKLTPRGHLQSSDRFFVEAACRLITRIRAGEVKASELNAVMNVLSKIGTQSRRPRQTELSACSSPREIGRGQVMGKA